MLPKCFAAIVGGAVRSHDHEKEKRKQVPREFRGKARAQRYQVTAK